MNQSEVEAKHTAGAKRGKIYHYCQAQESTQPVPGAGKHTTGVKRGKTYNWCQARENTRNGVSQVTIGLGVSPDWLRR